MRKPAAPSYSADRPRSGGARRTCVALSVLVLLITGVMAAVASSAPAQTVTLANPSLESGTATLPTCWSPDGSGTNAVSYARVSPGHTGAYAERVKISSYASGARRLVISMNQTCAPRVTPGHRYVLSGWYTSSGTAYVIAYYQDSTTGVWKYWAASMHLAAATRWTQATLTTPPVPSTAGRVSFGIALASKGQVTTDDYAMVDMTKSVAPVVAATTTANPSVTPTATPTAVTTSVNASPSAPTGSTWYVSRNGDNSAGTSWASAWNELANINWALVRPGDTVLVDGGATSCGSNLDITAGQPGTNCGMVYGTPLTVGSSGTSSAPITIRLAGDAGHNGTAVVFGGRATALPYCDQSSYSPVGVGRAAGISVPGRSNVVIDGTHRSGFMVYGAQNGVDLASDSTSFVTLRNLEIFDNGTYSTWSYGYYTDGDGVLLAGHDITIDRDLIHDNGQDEVHDRYTGPVNNNSHAALYNIAVTNSWMYVRRDHPQFTGYGFNAGSQDIAAQNCQHVDGIQIWGGGLHQRNLTVDHDVFGPLIAQGVYPGNRDTTSFDDVTVTNSLFLVLDHSIIGDSIASDPTTPANWLIANDTSFMTDQPPTGTNSHGKIDLAGTGHTIRNSVFYNGYYDTVNPATASGNVWWQGDPVPGAVNQNPGFAGPLPGTSVPTYAQYTGMNLGVSCAACGLAGAPVATTSGLLAAIDSADGAAP